MEKILPAANSGKEKSPQTANSGREKSPAANSEKEKNLLAASIILIFMAAKEKHFPSAEEMTQKHWQAMMD